MSEGQAAAPLLIADVRLDEGVGDPGPHGAQGSVEVSRLHAHGFDVVLQGQEGGLPAQRRYLRRETDADIQLSGAERPAALCRWRRRRSWGKRLSHGAFITRTSKSSGGRGQRRVAVLRHLFREGSRDSGEPGAPNINIDTSGDDDSLSLAVT